MIGQLKFLIVSAEASILPSVNYMNEDIVNHSIYLWLIYIARRIQILQGMHSGKNKLNKNIAYIFSFIVNKIIYVNQYENK